MKKVLVTGSSRGIGLSISKSLAESGYEVIITGRDSGKLAGVAEEINAAGFIAADLAENINIPEDIDVLVNNAGSYAWAPIDKIRVQEIERLIKLNLQVPIELCRLVVPHMKKQKWGRIINIGSISGAVGEANASLYSASKAGLIGFTKAMALELAEYGVTVNVINPGWVKTSMTAEFTDQETLDTIPQKRYIEPEEIAGLVKYLVSESARGVTGQGINLCCGLSLG